MMTSDNRPYQNELKRTLGLTSSRKNAVPLRGTRDSLTAYPALRSAACWAMICRPSGAALSNSIPQEQPESGAPPGTSVKRAPRSHPLLRKGWGTHILASGGQEQIPRSPRRPRDDKSRRSTRNPGPSASLRAGSEGRIFHLKIKANAALKRRTTQLQL